MKADLEQLRIDKSLKGEDKPPRWAPRWILVGVLGFVLLGLARFGYTRLTAVVEVNVMPVKAEQVPSGHAQRVVLNANGYIIAAHKIELASKVVGRVAWIGVERGDRVRKGQVVVRLEDDEYGAQLQQARGQLAALEARLQELLHGSRPEEIAAAKANVEQGRAELDNARRSLQRTRQLVEEKVLSEQALDDAKARHEAQAARVESLEKTYELVRIGPRQELMDQVQGQIQQARGAVLLYETQLGNTVIRAPVNGTILERNVEVGEFVTTSFVGERGAKGYVVSLADLNDLQVELDINQNNFAKLRSRQHGIISTDAYPDRKYEGIIEEISPEANRQKATVQVKVKILSPDDYLRPEMNASVAFLAGESGTSASGAAAAPIIYIPAGAVRDGAVFVVREGRVVRRPVKVAGTTPRGLRIVDGLRDGDALIVNPSPELRDGAKVRIKV